MNTENTALSAQATAFVRDTPNLRLVLDTAGTVRAASAAFCKLLDRTADDIVGHYIWNFTALDSLDTTLTTLNKAAMQPGAATFKQCWLNSNQDKVWLQWSYLPLSEDGLLLGQAHIGNAMQRQPNAPHLTHQQPTRNAA